ncbi:DNA-binding transcriptional regulator, MarR family [Arthrobacter alpinus]|uniref:DNA-binding transcriptional regulator, MarR family n=1 Tax=Arthrobacter alpinus TaxID=656366 RepID=A0A1H5PFC3_9MICC|nr:MarR family transcriptional regulator [Arthrobacter alpinus]SEF12324.1 DNA-binding transcriptional regulator, MarR family [Arthrobacter alpinus]
MDLAYELHDLVRTLDKWAERKLRPKGLSYNKYVALVIVSEHPGLTGRNLAKALGVTEAAGSGIVRSLLAAGLIVDGAPSGAGNVRSLSITEPGATVLAGCSVMLGSSLDDNAVAIGLDPHHLAETIRALHDEVRTVRPTIPTSRKEES